MDTWGTIVLVVDILLLVAGWVLFQQAKSELTARAAQMPVLAEVKALHRNVTALLEQLKLEAVQTSAQLEARCVEARDLLAALDRRLEDLQSLPSRPASRRRAPAVAVAVAAEAPPQAAAKQQESANPAADPRYHEVYALADAGLSAAEIAERTRFSGGEVELVLGLREQVS